MPARLITDAEAVKIAEDAAGIDPRAVAAHRVRQNFIKDQDAWLDEIDRENRAKRRYHREAEFARLRQVEESRRIRDENLRSGEFDHLLGPGSFSGYDDDWDGE